MSDDPFVIPDDVNQATADAFRRMYAAREDVRRRYFSDEAWASFPADAPEVIGVHSPDVMRAELKHRAVG